MFSTCMLAVNVEKKEAHKNHHHRTKNGTSKIVQVYATEVSK